MNRLSLAIIGSFSLHLLILQLFVLGFPSLGSEAGLGTAVQRAIRVSLVAEPLRPTDSAAVPAEASPPVAVKQAAAVVAPPASRKNAAARKTAAPGAPVRLDVQAAVPEPSAAIDHSGPVLLESAGGPAGPPAETGGGADRVAAADRSGGALGETGGQPDPPAGEVVPPVRLAVPLYRDNPPPVYPGLARRRGMEGTVLLEALVSEQGRVTELRVVTGSGHEVLDRSAEKAVRQWVFTPGRQGSATVASWVRVPVSFRLQGQ